MYEPVPLEALHQPEEAEVVGLGVVRLGDRLEHPSFGVGEVVHIEAGGPVTIVQLKFADGSLRSLVAEHAAERIAGIGGHGQNAALLQQHGALLEQARLGVVGVDFEILGHEMVGLVSNGSGVPDAFSQQFPDRGELPG